MTEADAEVYLRASCFRTGPPGRIGVELEWLVRDARDPARPVPLRRVAAAVADLTAPDVLPRPARLPSGGVLTVEPGGQLELSSAPAEHLAGLVTAVGRDLELLRAAMTAAGLELAGHGLDPVRPPRRTLDMPRYAAMEEFFDRDGPWGREMMCSTASVQVCIDAGRDGPGPDGYRARWRLAHAIGPVLVGAFANSPLHRGRPSGWRSTRQAVWARLDPGRTRPAVASRKAGGDDGDPGDPATQWTRYALDAALMCVRRPGSMDWTAPRGVRFRDWLRGAGERPPTVDDLMYHVSTLFPPVRPHGHLELRMIDAQPGDGWVVPVAVASALLDDPCAQDAALAAAEPLWRGTTSDGSTSDGWREGDPWLRAARYGPADPVIARAARQCFEAADAALGRSHAPAAIRRAVAAFAERYPARRRCPADDRLEEVQ